VTGVLDVGSVSSVDLAPGQNASLSFDGTGGEQLDLAFPHTFGDNFGSVVIRRPDGTQLVSAGLYTGAAMSIPVLPTTGTYTIVVDPRAAGSGSIDLTLTSLGIVSKPILPDGPGVLAEVVRPGGTQKLTFQGIQGQRMSISVSATTLDDGTVGLLAPDGTRLAEDPLEVGVDAFVDAAELPATGTYTIAVTAARTGTADVRLHDVSTHVFGSLVGGGEPTTVTTTKPGQNAVLAFSTTAGSVHRIALTSSTIAAGTMAVRGADGTAVAATSFGPGAKVLATRALPAGDYTVLIDPARSNVGSVTVALATLAADAPIRIEAGGPPVSAGWGTADEQLGLIFDAEAGDRVSVLVTEYDLTAGWAELLAPDGSEVAAWPVADGTAFIDTLTLPEDGTYTVRVDRRSAGSGRATFAVHAVPERSPIAIAAGGPEVRIEASVPGEDRTLSFSAAAGDTVSVVARDSTISFASIHVLGPSGTPSKLAGQTRMRASSMQRV
jgi:hypothetical protein